MTTATSDHLDTFKQHNLKAKGSSCLDNQDSTSEYTRSTYSNQSPRFKLLNANFTNNFLDESDLEPSQDHLESYPLLHSKSAPAKSISIFSYIEPEKTNKNCLAKDSPLGFLSKSKNLLGPEASLFRSSSDQIK